MRSPRDLFILALLVLMDVLAGFSLVIGSGLLDATSTGYGSFWLLLLAGLLGLTVGLGVAGYIRAYPWNRLALLTGGALTVVILGLLVSTGIVTFIATALLLGLAYWRGLAATTEPPVHDEVQRRLSYGFGLLLLGIVFVVARGVISEGVVWHLLTLTGIAYVMVGMAALVAARLETAREPGALGAVMLAVGLQLGLVLLICLGALALFTHDVGAVLAHLTQPLWTVVGGLLRDLVTLIFAPIDWLIRQLHIHQRTPHPLTAPPPGTGQSGPQKKLKSHPTDTTWVTVGALIVVALLLVGIAVLIWRTLPRIPRIAPNRGFTEERRALWSPAEAWRLLISWLRSLFSQGTAAAGHAVSATRRRVLGPAYPSDPVRRLYAQLLYRAEHAGLPRTPQLTPVEFRTRLVATWPQGAADFEALTDAYVLRRYGEVVPSDEQLERLRERWHRLRGLMRRPREQSAPEASETRSPTAAKSERQRSWLDTLLDPLPQTWREAIHATVSGLGREMVIYLAAVFGLILFLAFFVLAAVIFR